MLRCGDVLRLFDATAQGEVKDRWFVCLDPENGWFARIVTRRPRHQPVQLTQREHPFLDHDSYVEIGLTVTVSDNEIDQALAENGTPAGRISTHAAIQILAAWKRSELVPPSMMDAIVRHLTEQYRLS